jgi:uncharacterized protein (TIGR03435 family)
VWSENMPIPLVTRRCSPISQSGSPLVVILAFVGGVAVLSAQHPADQPTFDVASVRPNVSNDTRSYFRSPPGIRSTNVTLRTLIARAYEIPQTSERFTLDGGSDSILALRFDVSANEAEGTPPGRTMAMLRTLLAERFSLRTHRETRRVPKFAVTLARQGRLGPNLRPTTQNCAAFMSAGGKRSGASPPRAADGQELCRGDLVTGAALTLQDAAPFAHLLARIESFVGRPLVNATGLTGSYEWRLTFSIDAPSLSIYTALGEQLGLKLDHQTGPYEMLVIDSVERPTPD